MHQQYNRFDYTEQWSLAHVACPYLSCFQAQVRYVGSFRKITVSILEVDLNSIYRLKTRHGNSDVGLQLTIIFKIAQFNRSV